MDPIQTDPTKRLGIFKQVDDVPEQYRLESYHDQYRTRDVWGEFRTQVFFRSTTATRPSRRHDGWVGSGEPSFRTLDDITRSHDQAISNDGGRLPSRTFTPSTAYRTYWTKLEQFYSWLLWHPDHPHRSNPLLMAAANYESAGNIWAVNVGETDE